MKIDIFHILRVSVISVGAIALSACTRISGSGENSYLDEGLRQDMPEGVTTSLNLRGYQPVDELAMVDALESRVQALNFELKTLKSALEIMQPLDEPSLNFADNIDAVKPTRISASVSSKISVATPSVQTAVYQEAPLLENGQSLFRYADLAVYPTQGAAAADWKRLEAELNLEELTPYYDVVGGGVRLSTGPFANAEDLTRTCLDLRQVAGACEPANSGRMLQ